MTEYRTRVDDAIDRAVRDMLRRDPPAGFRRRVLSRLERASARSRAVAPVRRTFLWTGAAAAAAAIALLTIVNVGRHAPQVPVTSSPEVATRAPDNPPASPSIGVPGPGQNAAAEPIRRRVPRREPVRTATFGPRDGRVSAASVRDSAPPVAAPTAELATDAAGAPVPPPSGVTALIALRPLEIAPIVVPPIQIAPVQLAPLSPPR